MLPTSDITIENVSLIHTGNLIETRGLILKKNLSEKIYMEIYTT